jgi:hypothetical protein
MKVNDMSLVESLSLRNTYYGNVEVLDKVGEIVFFGNTEWTDKKTVAEFYNIPDRTLESCIKENKKELELNGYKVIKGKELKEFKGNIEKQCNLSESLKTSPSLGLFNRRTILNIGMLLRDSEIAKQVRYYLLNVEEKADDNIKSEAFEQMKEMFVKTNEELLTTRQILNNLNDVIVPLVAQVQELKKENTILNTSLDLIFNKKVPRDERTRFERAVDMFNLKLGFHETGAFRYNRFYESLPNWFNFDWPKPISSERINKKSFLLSSVGIDKIEQFVENVFIGRFIESDKGFWVDTEGIFKNDIEWTKIKENFDHECAYCGKKETNANKLQREHVVNKRNPESSNLIQNIVPACNSCNKAKLDNTLQEWREKGKYITKPRLDKIQKHQDNYDVFGKLKN